MRNFWSLLLLLLLLLLQPLLLLFLWWCRPWFIGTTHVERRQERSQQLINNVSDYLGDVCVHRHRRPLFGRDVVGGDLCSVGCRRHRSSTSSLNSRAFLPFALQVKKMKLLYFFSQFLPHCPEVLLLLMMTTMTTPLRLLSVVLGRQRLSVLL